MKKLLSSIWAIACCCVLMIIAATSVSAQNRSVKVMGENVRLRLGPSTTAAIYSFESIPIYPDKGDILPMLGQEGDWYKVRFNGQELYISKRFCQLSKEKASNIDERIMEYLNQEFMLFGDEVAKPLTVVGIDIDGDNRPESLAQDANGKFAVFSTRDSLACIGWFNSAEGVLFYPTKGVFRYYNGVGAGYESEFYYVMQGSRLVAQYRRQAEPLGDIHKQRNVRVKNTYTKVTYPGHVVEDIPEDTFWDYVRQFEGVEGERFSDMWDL